VIGEEKRIELNRSKIKTEGKEIQKSRNRRESKKKNAEPKKHWIEYLSRSTAKYHATELRHRSLKLPPGPWFWEKLKELGGNAGRNCENN